MTERDHRSHPEQPERSPEEMDGTNLLPDSLKERMPGLYSQENEPDPPDKSMDMVRNRGFTD